MMVVKSIYNGKENVFQFDIILFQTAKHPDITQYVTEQNIHKHIKLIYLLVCETKTKLNKKTTFV